MIKHRQLRCSFCGKNEAEVLKLVAGPRVYICDKCVAIASRIMDDSTGDSPLPEATDTGMASAIDSRPAIPVRL